MTATHAAYRTKTPGNIQVIHEAELSDNFRNGAMGTIDVAGTPVPYLNIWQMCCWDKFNERAFIRVTENSLDTNYPLYVLPIDSCLKDNIKVNMWDKHKVPYVRATCCSPTDVCGIELCGQSAATSFHPACNNTCGGVLGLRTYVPGLKDADAFCDAVNNAQKAKLASTISATVSAPKEQRM